MPKTNTSGIETSHVTMSWQRTVFLRLMPSVRSCTSASPRRT